MRIIWVWFFLFAAILSRSGDAAIDLRETANGVELLTDAQKLVAEKKESGLALSVQVKVGEEWKPLFDSDRPIVSGKSFDLRPSTFKVLDNAENKKSLLFSGRHRNPDYPWDLRADVSTAAPWIKFTIVCHLTAPLTIQGLEPLVALWSHRPSVAVQLDQGPDSIYRSAGVPHGFGFPAAYFWDEGIEAFTFFDMTPMTWMSPEGVWRFNDVRIQTRTEGEYTGLGMHLKKVSGTSIPAGDMVIPFYLCTRPRADKPSKFQALATMIETFAPLHPATSEWPKTVPANGVLTWKYFAGKAIENLMREGETMAVISAPWKDSPLELAEAQETMIVHPGRVAKTPEEARSSWDFSTVNNHLTPWILYARCTDNQDMYRVALAKANALPRFFDPKSGILRHGTRIPDHVGDMEMSWQNFFFHIEALRAAQALPEFDFNPAIAGRVLMAMRGLRQYANNVSYVFPQWFDPIRKVPITQNDMPQLGEVREPWQIGAYAYVAARAYNVSNSHGIWVEGFATVDRLMNGMAYRESNHVYSASYTDPVDFPITELFGNAYGSVAALEHFHGYPEKRNIGYARDILNTLLRLTFWYEDESDVVSRELKSVGLFYPHCGAVNACPWETVEANLCLAYQLKNDPENPLRELLLKLLNLNRINSFYFFPATYSESLKERDNRVGEQRDDFFPVEPFYTLEGPGGHRGPAAAYMASLAMWNYWMYEALAEVSPRDVMAVNLDTLENYDQAILGVQRSFEVFNPLAKDVVAELRLKRLPAGKYILTLTRNGEVPSRESMVAESLTSGIVIRLAPMQSMRISLAKEKTDDYVNKAWQSEFSRKHVIQAYSDLQTLAPRIEPEVRTTLRDDLLMKIQTCRAGNAEWYQYGRPVSNEAKNHGCQVRWVSLFTDELMNWMEPSKRKRVRDTTENQPKKEEPSQKTLVLPVYEAPSEKSVRIGTIEVVFRASQVLSPTFRAEGSKENISFTPDEYDSDWGYGPYCHQSIVERKGNWVLLPKNPMPKPGWISLNTPEGNLEVKPFEFGGIYMRKDESIVVVDQTNDGLLIRPEQGGDYPCGEAPLFKLFEIQERKLEDFRDAEGHWTLHAKYKRGC